MKVPVAKVRLLLDAARQPASLDAPVAGREETELGDLLEHTGSISPEEAALQSDMANQVEQAIAPLADPAWVAVRALVPRRDVNAIMDELAAIGAKAILAYDIRFCRF